MGCRERAKRRSQISNRVHLCEKRESICKLSNIKGRRKGKAQSKEYHNNGGGSIMLGAQLAIGSGSLVFNDNVTADYRTIRMNLEVYRAIFFCSHSSKFYTSVRGLSKAGYFHYRNAL